MRLFVCIAKLSYSHWECDERSSKYSASAVELKKASFYATPCACAGIPRTYILGTPIVLMENGDPSALAQVQIQNVCVCVGGGGGGGGGGDPSGTPVPPGSAPV